MSAYELALNKNLKTNIVLRIGTDYYATYQPDSGLSITDEFLQVQAPKLNGVTVDVRNSNSPISTFSFKLMEFEGSKTSSKIMLDETQFLEKEIVIYHGHVEQNFDFSDYIELGRTTIKAVAKIENGYSFTSREVTGLISAPALNRKDILKTALISTSTTLSISSTEGWPSNGIILVENEFMAYTGIDPDGITLTGLVRGIYTSEAVEHTVGSEVYQVTPIEGVNPVDIFLQILLSKNGDGTNHPTYDVLENGLGINPDNVDISSIEQIRDENFNTELHTIYVFNVENMLKYLEKELLPSTNLRIINYNGRIGLSLLDQVNFEGEAPILDENSIIGTPTWSLTSDKVVNIITVEWDYNQATRKFESSKTFKDQDSINTFGEKPVLTLKMRSVKTSLGGEVIAQERALRLLNRLSTARGRVSLRCHLDRSPIQVGDNTQLVHRFLPQQGGTLGMSDQLEVMSRSIDLERSIATFKLEFTSYTGIRIPFIAPSPKVSAVASQRVVTVDSADGLQVGYQVNIFKKGLPDSFGNPTAGEYLPDSSNTIESINGNEITFVNEWTTTLENDFILKMSDYEEANDEQKARYAYIGSNTGFFNDGSKNYQIIF